MLNKSIEVDKELLGDFIEFAESKYQNIDLDESKEIDRLRDAFEQKKREFNDIAEKQFLLKEEEIKKRFKVMKDKYQKLVETFKR